MMTNLDFKRIEAADMKTLAKYTGLRPNKTCDSLIFDYYLWRDYLQIRYAICDEKAIQWLMERDGLIYSAMPMCREEDLKHYFYELVEYFNEVLHQPLQINLADEEAVCYLGLKENVDFEVTEQEDLKDYLYDRDALIKLSGKKLYTKKQLFNAFLRDYGDRYEYCQLGSQELSQIFEFINKWRREKGENADGYLDYETEGIYEVLRNYSHFQTHMAGVFIDGKLEAFTIGSYNSLENMVVIHVEKANAKIRGLYQFINRQFLLHEFKDAVLVNREEDLGKEGLRKSKMSYRPMDFARKYRILQKSYVISNNNL